MIAPLALSLSVPPGPGPVNLLNAVRAPFHVHPPYSVAMFVVRSYPNPSVHFAVVCGPWVNPRHGRGPQALVAALTNRGTEVLYIHKILPQWAIM